MAKISKILQLSTAHVSIEADAWLSDDENPTWATPWGYMMCGPVIDRPDGMPDSLWNICMKAGLCDCDFIAFSDDIEPSEYDDIKPSDDLPIYEDADGRRTSERPQREFLVRFARVETIAARASVSVRAADEAAARLAAMDLVESDGLDWQEGECIDVETGSIEDVQDLGLVAGKAGG